MAISQAYLFLIFALNGVFIGLLFDIFRILRKSFKTTNLVTYIEDILFWILSGISIIFSMYNFSNGTLRIYMFIGIAFGIIIYLLTLSNVVIKTLVYIITFLKKILKTTIKIIFFPIKYIYKFLEKLILRPFYLFYIKTKLILTKNMKNFNKSINKLKKCKKIIN